MNELRPALVFLAQAADGVSLNVTTLGIVTGMVLGLATAITVLFRMVTSNQQRQIDKLTTERDLYLTQLLETMRTAGRSTDAAEDAARQLTGDRKTPRKR